MIIDDMEFAEEEAYLIKKDGSRIQIMAEIQTDIAFISDINTPIQIGDLLDRPRGSITDRYEVVNVLPYSKTARLNHIPPHIQAKIVPYREHANTTGSFLKVNGNISGSTVVINSGNNASINVTSNHNNFEDLIKAIKSVSAPQEIVESVRDLEANVGKSSFKEKYNNFIASMANHVTVLQAVMPFLPWLSNL